MSGRKHIDARFSGSRPSNPSSGYGPQFTGVFFRTLAPTAGPQTRPFVVLPGTMKRPPTTASETFLTMVAASIIAKVPPL